MEARATLGLIWDPEAAPVTDPVASLLALAGKLERAVDTLGARLDTEPDLEGATAQAWVRVLTEQRKALEGIERLNLHERQVELEQAQAAQVVGAVRVALEAAGLEAGQQDTFVRTFLAALGRGQSLPVVAGEVTR